VFLRPYNGGLMLHTMYYQEEVREMPAVEPAQIKEAELKVAHQLIQALAGDWDPAKYHDTFEENVKKLIKAHLEGKQVSAVEKPRKVAPPTDLMEALRQSLAQTGKKGPQRAETTQEESEVQVRGRKAGRKKPAKKAA
jgi:DNA end-binding protein Ku